MAEFPAMPLWTDAYLADTMHLSDAEHGRYLMALADIWRSPDCRATCGERPDRDIFSEFFCLEDGFWTPYGAIAERHVDWSLHPCRLLRSAWRSIRAAVLSNHDGGCVACGCQWPLEVDHIIPRCLGGTNAWGNLQVLCRTCNRRKGGRL